MPTLDGSTSRTLVLLTALISSAFLCWAGKVDGEVFSVIVAAVIGGAVHASGTKQGSEASQAPPPAE